MRLRTKLMALGTGVTLLAVTGAASAAAGTGWAIQPTPNPAAGSTLVFVSHDERLASRFDVQLSLADINRAVSDAESFEVAA